VPTASGAIGVSDGADAFVRFSALVSVASEPRPEQNQRSETLFLLLRQGGTRDEFRENILVQLHL